MWSLFVIPSLSSLSWSASGCCCVTPAASSRYRRAETRTRRCAATANLHGNNIDALAAGRPAPAADLQ